MCVSKSGARTTPPLGSKYLTSTDTLSLSGACARQVNCGCAWVTIG
jgi:hypothetical protein